MDRLKNLIFHLVLGYGLTVLSVWMDSPFLLRFLSENLITMLVALMAINTTTRGVLMTKLREISDKTNADFSRTLVELRSSMVEQLWCIVIALAASMFYASGRFQGLVPWPEIVFGGLLASVFVASMSNLYDTGQAIFVILRNENKKP